MLQARAGEPLFSPTLACFLFVWSHFEYLEQP